MSSWSRIRTWDDREQIQKVARAGLEPGTAGLWFDALTTGLKNGWTCALKLWGSSRHSIFKMADDEWKFYTSLWRLFATSCSPKAFKFCVTEHNEDCCLGLRHDGTNRNGGVILMKRSTQRLLKQYFTFSEFSQGTVLPWYKVVSASIRF